MFGMATLQEAASRLRNVAITVFTLSLSKSCQNLKWNDEFIQL